MWNYLVYGIKFSISDFYIFAIKYIIANSWGSFSLRSIHFNKILTKSNLNEIKEDPTKILCFNISYTFLAEFLPLKSYKYSEYFTKYIIYGKGIIESFECKTINMDTLTSKVNTAIEKFEKNHGKDLNLNLHSFGTN